MDFPAKAAAAAFVFLLAGSAFAAEFKTIDQCRPGAKVQDRKNRVGTITRVSNGMCYVRFDGEGKDQNVLHWMLRPAAARAAPSEKLANGVYKCYHSGGYAFIDIRIDGPSTYRDKDGKRGRYRLDATSGKITFESGTLEKANAKLFSGPRIGLNMDGKSIYSVTCSPTN